eukprot:1342757-Pleurochrysis_carterae.AAC.5
MEKWSRFCAPCTDGTAFLTQFRCCWRRVNAVLLRCPLQLHLASFDLGKHRCDSAMRRPRNLTSTRPRVLDANHLLRMRSVGYCGGFDGGCDSRLDFETIIVLP